MTTNSIENTKSEQNFPLSDCLGIPFHVPISLFFHFVKILDGYKIENYTPSFLKKSLLM